jgi:hypothetical protein
MTEQNRVPEEEPTERETAVPLPERDAMSIIGLPQPVPDGEVLPAGDPSEPAIQPNPRYDL